MRSTFTYREPIKVLADILAYELILANGQVMLKDQKFNIPSNPGLFISLEYLGPSKVISSTNRTDMFVTPPMERQAVTTLWTVQVDTMSFNEEARTRLPEISAAINSVYSQQLQERYQLSIAKNPSPFSDASSLEATANLKRYTALVLITALYRKDKVVGYYDTFRTAEVITNV